LLNLLRKKLPRELLLKRLLRNFMLLRKRLLKLKKNVKLLP
jgi:hypothetical protein